MLFKPTVPQLLTKGENRYRLVIASAKRARQIAQGAPILTDKKGESPETIAVWEIYEEKVKKENS